MYAGWADLLARMRARRRGTRRRVRQQSITQGRACSKQGAITRKEASKVSRHATNMAKQALCDARGGMFTSTRAAVRRPSSICAHKGESAGHKRPLAGARPGAAVARLGRVGGVGRRRPLAVGPILVSLSCDTIVAWPSNRPRMPAKSSWSPFPSSWVLTRAMRACWRAFQRPCAQTDASLPTRGLHDQSSA
jgi:hypothetical protein